MFWALQELAGPGDHAIVTVPNYQSMETVTARHRRRGRGLVLRPEDGWAPDLDELAALLRPEHEARRGQLPQQPDGRAPRSRRPSRALVALCDEHGILLFSDEVYRGLELDPARSSRRRATCRARAISLNVMSKAYGLPGLRIGWLATHDRALLERLERRKHYTSICNAAPSEFLATLALRNGDAIRARNRGDHRANLPVFDAFFAALAGAVRVGAPAGGCVCFPRYLGEGRRFCRDLVDEAGVVLLPADIYASELGRCRAIASGSASGAAIPSPRWRRSRRSSKEEWTAALVRRDGPEVAKGRRVSGRGCWTARGPYLLGGGQPPVGRIFGLRGPH